MRPYLLPFLSCLALASSARADAVKLTRIGESALPPGIHVVGKLIDAVSWSDKAGDHVAAFSRELNEDKGSARLQVELWSGKGQKGKVVRTLKDALSSCDFDLYADFIDAALGLTDLDGDGVAELTFAYRTTCTSDVSPFTLKLFLVEQRAKYALRGTTRIDEGDGESVGGEKKADAALKRQPAFLRHAEAVWEKIVALNPWG